MLTRCYAATGNRTTRSQTANAAPPPTNLQEDEEMTDGATGVVPETIPASTASGPSDTQMAVDPTDAELRDTLPFAEVDLDDEAEYQRLKRAEEKALRAQEMQRLRARESQGWAPLMDLPIRNANPTLLSPPPIDADLDRQLRAERGFDITKPAVYNAKSILELEGFLRGLAVYGAGLMGCSG